MPSYKWIYRAGQYLAGIFAAGVWRGKGMTIVPPIASHFLVLEGPSQETIVLSIDHSIEIADWATWEDDDGIIWEDGYVRIWEDYVVADPVFYDLEGPSQEILVLEAPAYD
jgi:hypothetical protein